MRRALTALCTASALYLTAAPAAAGGWWTFIDLEETYVAHGERVTARTLVMFDSIEEAEEARRSGSFAAYLVRGLDWAIVRRAMGQADPGDWWRLGSAEAIRLGPVRLSHWNANLARASARFVVPDLPRGSYAFMFCTERCRDALADVIPSRVLVTDPATDHLSEVTTRLDRRLDEVERAARVAARRSGDIPETSESMRRLQLDLAEMRAEIAALRNRDARQTPLVAFAGWFAAGAATFAVMGLALRLRRVRRRAVIVPDDVRELVGSAR